MVKEVFFSVQLQPEKLRTRKYKTFKDKAGKSGIDFINHITSHHRDSQKEQLFFRTINPSIKLATEETVVQLQHMPEKSCIHYPFKKIPKVGKSKCFFSVQILTEKGMNSINSTKHITSKHKTGRSEFLPV